jgi:hypothetical protein
MGIKLNKRYDILINIPLFTDGFLVYEDPDHVFWSYELKTGQKRYLAKNINIPDHIYVRANHGLLTIQNPYKLHVFTKNSYFVINHEFKYMIDIYIGKKYLILNEDEVLYVYAYNRTGYYVGCCYTGSVNNYKDEYIVIQGKNCRFIADIDLY